MWEPSITFSLLFIVVVLLLTIIASVTKNAIDKRRDGAEDPDHLQMSAETRQLNDLHQQSSSHALVDVGCDGDEPLFRCIHRKKGKAV